MRQSCFLMCSLLTLMLFGCGYPKNDRLAIGASYTPPSIHSHHRSVLTDSGPTELFSLRSIDRSGWNPTTVVAHFDGVVHGHLIRLLPPTEPNSTPRRYGRFPTDLDALDPQLSHWSGEMWNTLKELGRSTIGSDYAFFYLAWEGELLNESISPFPYKRSKQSDWSSGQPALLIKERDHE